MPRSKKVHVTTNIAPPTQVATSPPHGQDIDLPDVSYESSQSPAQLPQNAAHDSPATYSYQHDATTSYLDLNDGTLDPGLMLANGHDDRDALFLFMTTGPLTLTHRPRPLDYESLPSTSIEFSNLCLDIDMDLDDAAVTPVVAKVLPRSTRKSGPDHKRFDISSASDVVKRMKRPAAVEP